MPTRLITDRLNSILAFISDLVVHHAWKTLLAAFVFTVLTMSYITENLGVNTDTSDMLSPDLPYQVNLRKLEHAFAQDQNTIISVIHGTTPEQAKTIAQQLLRTLQQKDALFKHPDSPGNSQFFDQNGLLYLTTDELNSLATNLAQAQPFLGKLAVDYRLEGLFPILQLALESAAKQQELPVDITQLLRAVTSALQTSNQGQHNPVSWQAMMLGNNANLGQTEQLVIAQPIQDFNLLLPAGQAMDFLREQRAQLIEQYPGADIKITGAIALDHEELESALSGAVLSAILALTLIVSCLYIGLRSVKLVLATFIILITGLIWTAGFAALAVGHLNLISLAFAVLYIGLGVDYAIHYCLRYQETPHTVFNRDDLVATTRAIGLPFLLCALTTSIGFFAFIPTDFLGVSELGIIAGTGIFIGLFVTITLLPALLCVLNAKAEKTISIAPRWLTEFPIKHHQSIKFTAILAALLALILSPKIIFDADPINLKDPHAESVQTFRSMLRSEQFSPLTMTALAYSEQQARELATQVKSLDQIKNVITLYDFIPLQQDEKLDIIENLGLLISSSLNTLSGSLLATQHIEPLLSLQQTVASVLQSNNTAIDTLLLLDLNTQLLDFIDQYQQNTHPLSLLTLLQNNLLGNLPFTMQSLAKSLNANTVELKTLPSNLSSRWLSEDTIFRVEILPQADLNDLHNLRQFVRSVQTLAPDVTGLPVVYIESSDAIVKAFRQAFLSAFCLITLILLLTLRSIKATALVIWPLALAGLLTCASTVIFNTPFNFVNVIALPLLLGVGVDNGIHVIQRIKDAELEHNPLQTNTARAIFFSNLTTLFSFCSLAFTPHLGTSSMGLLLTVGLLFTIISTLIILPAFRISSTTPTALNENKHA